MRRPSIVVAVTVAAGAAALLWADAARRRDGTAYPTYAMEAMTSRISVTAPEGSARRAAGIVLDVFRDVDATMSEWKPGSPLSAVNEAAGRGPVAVPDDLRAVVRRGLEIGARTDGAFDVTWAALWGLWDFRADPPRVPDDEAIAARVALVDSRRLVVDDEAGTLALPEPGMMVGLGGIAKGHALDRAARALRDAGIDDFLLSAAGQMMAGGRRGDRPWRIGIRDPRGDPDDHFASLELTDASISTSGDYERFFILDGVRYHHILDPRTGRPCRGLRSATVVCADATLADALSTALMILGRERALPLAETWPGVEALLVDADGGVHMTSGLVDRVRMRHPPAP
ncbi:MAG: FAD:protein FMN transferase [Planctomycetota bacterium]